MAMWGLENGWKILKPHDWFGSNFNVKGGWQMNWVSSIGLVSSGRVSYQLGCPFIDEVAR